MIDCRIVMNLKVQGSVRTNEQWKSATRRWMGTRGRTESGRVFNNFYSIQNAWKRAPAAERPLPPPRGVGRPGNHKQNSCLKAQASKSGDARAKHSKSWQTSWVPLASWRQGVGSSAGVGLGRRQLRSALSGTLTLGHLNVHLIPTRP